MKDLWHKVSINKMIKVPNPDKDQALSEPKNFKIKRLIENS
jgi:hypothetical protein